VAGEFTRQLARSHSRATCWTRLPAASLGARQPHWAGHRVQDAQELLRHFEVRLVPAESFLDTGNRSAFANGGAAVALHPDFASRAREAHACAPLVLTGPLLDAVRQRLKEQPQQGGAQPEQTFRFIRA
jgi:hypothetical protein